MQTSVAAPKLGPKVRVAEGKTANAAPVSNSVQGSTAKSESLYATTKSFSAPKKSFSDVFWDLIFSATGYTKQKIDEARQTDPQALTDITELINRDLSWCAAEAVQGLRADLQTYITALRALKAENAKSIKARQQFVDAKRYEAIRSRECASRVTLDRIRQRFVSLDLRNRQMESITDELALFSELRTLLLSQNKALTELRSLPSLVEAVIASGCSIQTVSDLGPCEHLHVLGLAHNAVTDVSFLLSSRSLVCLDLRYNPLHDLDELVTVLQGHPTLQELRLRGCPVTLLPQYQNRMRSLSAEGHSRLQLLDGTNLSDDDGPAANAAVPSSSSSGAVEVYFALRSIKGTQSLLPVEDSARAQSAGKGTKPQPKAAKAPAGKGAAAEEEKVIVPPASFTCAVMGEWCSPALHVRADELNLTPPPAPVTEDPKAAKAKKGPAVDQPTVTVVDEVKIKEVYSTTVRLTKTPFDALRAPFILDFFFSETVHIPVAELNSPPQSPALPPATPGQSSSAKYTTKSTTTHLGTFTCLLYPLLLQLAESNKLSEDVEVPLVVQEEAIADAKFQLRNMTATLSAMVKDDAALDQELADDIVAENQAAEQAAVAAAAAAAAAAPPDKKGKAPAAKQAAVAPVRQLSAELQRRQADSALRKAAIEALSNTLAVEEKRTERLANAKLSLLIKVGLNRNDQIAAEELALEEQAAKAAAAPPPPAKKK